MAYSDEGVRAKLSALNETQESIVTVAQWIMFHRRYADRSASVWLQKVKDSGASKRLNLIYLANEVVQQSKARRKDDFLIAFSPIVAEATSTAYRGAISEVQSKLRRVIEVWRQRQIFELPIQEAIEARISEIDKSRSSTKKPLLGANPFSSPSSTSAPPELQPLVPLQAAISKAAVAVSNTTSAPSEYEKHMGPDASLPPAPVHAARLSALLKTLANAEGAVSEIIKARRDLITGLEKLLDTNRTALEAEETQYKDLSTKRIAVEAKKRDVEDEILRKLPSESPNNGGLSGHVGDHLNGDHDEEMERPQMEELTPPPVSSSTPLGSPNATADPISVGAINKGEGLGVAASGQAATRAFSGSPSEGAASKRRKMENEHQEFVAGDAMAELDEEVAALLRAEGGQR